MFSAKVKVYCDLYFSKDDYNPGIGVKGLVCESMILNAKSKEFIDLKCGSAKPKSKVCKLPSSEVK